MDPIDPIPGTFEPEGEGDPSPGCPGMDNREIGKTLFISEKTAKNYVTSIRKKLGLKNRTQIALFALERGRS